MNSTLQCEAEPKDLSPGTFGGTTRSREGRNERAGMPISMSYDSTKRACCQEKYIVGELLVRTDWEVVGGAGVTDDKHAQDVTVWRLSLMQETLRCVRLPQM